MNVWGFTEKQIQATVDFVSAYEYSDNLIVDRLDTITESTLRTNLKLRVVSSRGPGHRLAARAHHNTGNRRHLVAACWHAHRDVLTVLFDMQPEARIKTCFADYRGQDGFLRLFPATYRRNAGSQVEPVFYGQCCDCG